MSNVTISESIKYIGADDTTLDLFESQYIIPNGISYNSYVILDEKVAVMDTIDARKSEEWFNNLSNVLAGRNVDYIVISHLEPDHAANIKALSDKYPDAKLVLSAKAKAMLPQFFAMDNLDDKCITVAEGQELSLGTHNLKFIMAPMVHWPEVMLEYETTEKVLFSADAFGKFGALSASEDWTCEARRYYFNIVGKYGAPVQTLLKKAAALDIRTICPLHGPVLKENLEFYIGKYLTWSSYEPEDDGVLVACASILAILRQPLKRWLIFLKKRDLPKLHLLILQEMICQKLLKMLSDTAGLLLLQHLMMVVYSHLWKTFLAVFPTKLIRTVKSESSKMARGHLLPANV